MFRRTYYCHLQVVKLENDSKGNGSDAPGIFLYDPTKIETFFRIVNILTEIRIRLTVVATAKCLLHALLYRDTNK
jgi:hypothetical protein